MSIIAAILGVQVIQTPAVIDSTGNVTAPAVLAEGFHANALVAGDTPPALAPYAVTPESPSCVYAKPLADGVRELFLRFEDEAEAKTILTGAGWVDPANTTQPEVEHE